MNMKKAIALLTAVAGMIIWGTIGNATAGNPQTMTFIVDVGAGASIGMGSGGMGGSVMTGGGPVIVNGQQFGMMMHTSMMATMQDMMGQMQSRQHHDMDFDIPGQGTAFAVMTGGNPWTGGKGMIMGGTDNLKGISGTFTVGDQVGPNRYQFTCTFTLP